MAEMRYDLLVDDRIGIMKRFGHLVFIKTGWGGTIYGKDNKYLKLAAEIKDKFEYSVAVSANPSDSICDLNEEIEAAISQLTTYDKIIFIGVSNGALVGAQQGWKDPRIDAMLLIHGPLMINWHKTKKGIENFNGYVRFLYGDLDPSYSYVELLNLIESDNYEYRILEGVDHVFSGVEQRMVDEIMDFLGEVYEDDFFKRVCVSKKDTGLPYDFFLDSSGCRADEDSIRVIIVVGGKMIVVFVKKSDKRKEFNAHVPGGILEANDATDIVVEYIWNHYDIVWDHHLGRIDDLDMLNALQ